MSATLATFCPHCHAPNRAGARFCAICGRALAGVGLPAGATLQDGRYRVVRPLGRGGNSAVYLVEDRRLARACVAKALQGYWATAAERKHAAADFAREARILARLSTEHPGLPQTYDYFAEGERLYLIMQYVPGATLDARLRTGGPLTEGEAVGIGAAVAEVLAFLHAQQPQPVVHRDVKPANLILDGQGRIKLVDFGLAKALPAAGSGLGLGTGGHTSAAGTAGYTPPEQWALRPEARSDVYALGATLHHLLTGRDPYDAFRGAGELNLELIGRLSVFPALRTLRPDVAPALERLVRAMLLPEPATRPPAAEVQATLAGLLKPGRGVVAPRVPRRAAAPPPATAILSIPPLARPQVEALTLAWVRQTVTGLPPTAPVPIRSAALELVPFALGHYTIAARFTDPAGQLLRALNAEGVCVLDGVDGKPTVAPLADLLAQARPALCELAPPTDSLPVPFRLTATQLRDALIAHLTATHTQRVSYRSAQNRRYTRTCKPSRSAIRFDGGAPLLLHYPRWTVTLQLGGQPQTLILYPPAPGQPAPLVEAPALHGTALCPGCGLLFLRAHLIACAACGRGVCARCVVYRSRLGLFRKPFCSAACAAG